MNWRWGWGLFWIGVFAVGIVGEVVALASGGPGDTLSEHVWLLLDTLRGLPGGAGWVMLVTVAGLGLGGWVALHWLQHLMRRGDL